MVNRDVWIHLVNFGLVIFIWTIQLVVYPSFKYFSADSLLKWHSVYTSAVTVIVMPLMVTQIALHGWRLYNHFSAAHGLMMLLVISTWAVTFVVFVPLHNKIALNQDLVQTLSHLISYNWMRTILWSMIFLVGLFIAQK
jgi:hypothetical protein